MKNKISDVFTLMKHAAHADSHTKEYILFYLQVLKKEGKTKESQVNGRKHSLFLYLLVNISDLLVSFPNICTLRHFQVI
jgi:hypothetical protein